MAPLSTYDRGDGKLLKLSPDHAKALGLTDADMVKEGKARRTSARRQASSPAEGEVMSSDTAGETPAPAEETPNKARRTK